MFPNAFVLNSVRNYSSSSVTLSYTAQQNLSLNVFSNTDLIKLLNEQPLPSFERPILASIGNMTSTDERKLTQLHCKEEIIKWLISVLLMDASSSSVQSIGTAATNNSSATSGLGSSIQTDHYSSSSSSTIGTLIAGIDMSVINRFNDGDNK